VTSGSQVGSWDVWPYRFQAIGAIVALAETGTPMSDTNVNKSRASSSAACKGGAGGIWFLGFIGALCYYLHTHSGTFWLVFLAFMKSVVWPAFVVYHVLTLK